MTRTEIIQLLIDRYDLKSYVEIGLQKKSNNFDKIKCLFKLSVDPDENSDADVPLTSDEYFKELTRTIEHRKIDLFFIDGFHEREQVGRDIDNALMHLSDKGFIVVHDCNPPSELVQRMPRPERSVTKSWTGDVWKTIVDLRDRKDIRTYTVNADWGCAVIQGGENKFTWWNGKPELTYDNLDKNRGEWLNLISVETFIKYMTE